MAASPPSRVTLADFRAMQALLLDTRHQLDASCKPAKTGPLAYAPVSIKCTRRVGGLRRTSNRT